MSVAASASVIDSGKRKLAMTEMTEARKVPPRYSRMMTSHAAAFSCFGSAQGTDNQEENEYRRDSFQRTDEKIAQNADGLGLRNDESEEYAENKSGDDPLDETYAVPLCE